MFTAGSTAEIVIAGSDSIVAPISNPFGTSLQDRVTAQLQTVSGFAVTQFTVNTGISVGVLGDTYPYTAILDITAGQDYGAAQDIANVLANLFYVASGYYPTSVGVSKVNNASTGVVTQSNPTSPLAPITSAFSALSNIGPIVLGTLAIAIGLIVFVVVKNPPKIKL